MAVKVSRSEVCPPAKERTPAFERVNLVTPEADAAIKSPLFKLLIIKPALEPIPPETDKGAGVLPEEPISTVESKSEESIRSPVPCGVRVKLSSETVPIVAAAPLPRFKVVLVMSLPVMVMSPEKARVAALVKVARPEAVRVVSDESKVKVLLPELRVSPFVVV